MHLNVPPKHDTAWAPPRDAALPPAPRKPWLAALCSLLWPGLGQVYAGRFRRGVVLLGLAALWNVLGVGAVEQYAWWLAYLGGAGALCLWAAWDARRLARAAQDFLPGPRNTPKVYALCILAYTLAGFAAFQAEQWAFPVYTVSQASMRPTLRAGDRLRCRLIHPGDVIRRGQLVVFQYPSDHSLVFVKRVVGLPGEEVEVENGLVYVNGDPIEESFYAFRKEGEKGLDVAPTLLKGDAYFVLGDNRSASFDSRSFGPVERERMLATPLYVIYSYSNRKGEMRLDRIGLPAR